MDKTTVLIVEDEEIVAADLASKLGQLGYEVVGSAAEANEAVEMACSMKPHVVLMDIRLKGPVDGIEAAEAIRVQIDVPLIYLTAYSDAATLARAKLSGPFGYILKPFEERDLSTTIELAIYKHQLDTEKQRTHEALQESEARLQAINEELQNANEELQAQSEELQKQSEELQAQNEELARLWEESRRAEEALRKSQQQNEFLADIVMHAAQPFGQGYPDGRLGLINKAFEELSGYSGEELMSIDWARALTPPEWRELEREKLEELNRTGKPVKYEKEYIRKDGTRVSIELLVHIVTDSEGNPEYYYSFLTDITDRKLAENALKQLNEELEDRVAERTEELATTIDNLQIEIVEREKAEENLLRLNRLYAVLSETNQAIVRIRDRDSLFNDFCRIAVENGCFKLAWIGLVDEESGELKIVAANGATGYLDDIKITVKEEPEGLGPTGISVREGTYYICNDFLGSPVTRPWHERGKAYDIRASASIALEQEGRVIGALTLYADKKDFFDQDQVELLRQMGVDISFALDNICRETRRLQAEQDLQVETLERLRSAEALREKDQMLLQQSRQAAMGEMIGNIAHQWRQPLNALGLKVQQLPLCYDHGEFTREFLVKNVTSSMELIKHMSKTIDDFRNYFRPDKEKVTFYLSESITDTLSLVNASFKDQNIDIEILAKHDAVIYGYRNEFAQVLLNILNNARDALIEREIKDPRVTITICGESKRAILTVTDNAGGIPEEILGKIFDPYFSTKGPQAGTGVGLYMSKSIIEKNMGGTLTVRNITDGAEFRIEV
jgi:PAS domain S-box-containing protein